MKRQLPVVDPLVIGVPDQPPARHAMLRGQLVDLQRPCVDHLVAVFVHVLGLDDLLSAAPAQDGKQPVQPRSVVGPGGGRKGAARQCVGDICFQRTFRHIDHPGAGIAHKVDGTARGDAHGLACGTEGKVFCSLLSRRVVLVPDGVVQPGLKAMDQAVHTLDGDEDARCPCMELHRPPAAAVLVETGDARYCTAHFGQCRRDQAALIGRRGAPEAEPVDLLVSQPPPGAQVFPVGGGEGQYLEQGAQRPMDLLVRCPL